MITKRNIVKIENPHITSRAALLLLKEQLGKEGIQEYLKFRNEFFDENEPLKCHYCSVENLQRDINDFTDKAKLKTLATIDHVIPISKGGLRFDKKNCVVACFPCNNNKKDKLK